MPQTALDKHNGADICRHDAEGRTAGINSTVVFEAQSFRYRGRLMRMRDLLQSPATLKAYLAEHCATEIISASADVFAVYSPRYYDTAADAVNADVTMCVNTTYMEDTLECEPRLVAACFVTDAPT